MKKGQDILIASVAIFFIIFGIILYVSPELGESLTPAGEGLTRAELTDVQQTCLDLCKEAQNLTQSVQWETSSYCEYTYSTDGQILHCWEEPISVSCQAQLLYGGYPALCDQNKCLRGCR